MSPELSKKYIREFVRVLAPGGLLVFQLPSGPAHRSSPAQAASDEPLPDSAFKARLAAASPSMEAKAGSLLTIRVTATNLGDVTWPVIPHGAGKREIGLGNHWYDDKGELVTSDEGRTYLPEELKPGETMELPLLVRTPAEPGRYVLELDMVQEYVAWFACKGSETTRVPVEVRAGDTEGKDQSVAAPCSVTAAASAFVARMELHCVDTEEVLKLIHDSGGKILDAFVDDAAGEKWVSYRYAATK